MRRLQTARHGTLLVVLALLAAPSSLLAGGGTPAYKWSVDQRLSARLDPADAEKRLQAIKTVPAPEPGTNVVDGAKNPELLLPFELFSTLLKRGFAEDIDARKSYRAKLEPLANELEMGTDFWPALAGVASDVIPWSTSGRTELTREELCKVSYEALSAARKAFGKKTFDRFLYEGVAPGIKVSYEGSELEKELRDWENGCSDTMKAAAAF